MDLNNDILFIKLSLLLFGFVTGVLTKENNCKFDVKLTQSLLNEGFHRNLTYGIVFNVDDEEDQWLYKDCTVALDQTLPPGVFANPDELGDFKRSRGLNVIPKNKINIELTAEDSEPSGVYMIGKVAENKVYLWLPVHARYHKAKAGGGTARNTIPAPTLHLRCPDPRLTACGRAARAVSVLCNGSSKEKCSWKEIPYTMMSEPLVWEVPVGNTDDYYIVAGGTAVVIIVASVYLLKTIHEYKVNEKKKKQY